MFHEECFDDSLDSLVAVGPTTFARIATRFLEFSYHIVTVTLRGEEVVREKFTEREKVDELIEIWKRKGLRRTRIIVKNKFTVNKAGLRWNEKLSRHESWSDDLNKWIPYERKRK